MRSLAALIATGLLLGGCYEEIEPETSAESPPAETTPGDDLAGRGGGSALGKAKESAENTVSEVERRNQELMKQMEDDE